MESEEVEIKIRLKKNYYEFLKTVCNFNASGTPEEFVARQAESALDSLLDDMPPNWWDRTAIAEKHNLPVTGYWEGKAGEN